ncbi:MAG: TIGR04282 family arsenosugar biosynthesis glycosyltransferase [Acidimicrobiia bacterium]
MTAPLRHRPLHHHPLGRSFWIGLAIGAPFLAFGLASTLRHADATSPPDLARWLGAILVTHDLVLVPVVGVLGLVLVRIVPRVVRAPVQFGLFASAVVVGVAYPAIRGFGRLPNNPTVQPLDYAPATLTVLAVVWATTALWAAARIAARRRTGIALAVIAKAPRPGLTKTRLCPPCTPTEAAEVAQAALEDTLAVMLETPVPGPKVAVLDGEPGPWLPPGVAVVHQRDGDLGERLAGAFDELDGPVLVIAMDTPQVTPELLGSAARALDGRGTDAVIGLTDDGGYWAIGLRRPDRRVFEEVPMSSPETGRAQLARLRDLGLSTKLLPRLRDVDTFDDALAVAEVTPDSRFASVVRGVTAGSSPTRP